MSDMSATGAVIGIIGNDVPRQLLLAAGALPYRLTGSWVAEIDAEASELLGAADAVTVRILSELRAQREDLDALVICNDSQSHLRLFYALRATGSDLPLHLLDVPEGDSTAVRRFAEEQYRALIDFCARITGRMPDAQSLRAAADVEQALGRALARLRDARHATPPTCSGSRALEIYLAASRLHPVDAVVEADAARGGELTPGVRVHMTGSSHPDPSVYRELEEQGCAIVGEDHDTGDHAWLGQAFLADSVDEVIAGLVDSHNARVSASSSAFSAERAELTATMAVDERADIVAAFVRELDEAPLWDLPDQITALGVHRLALLSRTRIRPGAQRSTARELATEITGKVSTE